MAVYSQLQNVNSLFQGVFPQPVIQARAPETSDLGYPLGQVWINTASDIAYILVALDAGSATWSVASAGSGDLDTLTGDSGGPISPAAGNITLAGGTNITSVGAANTITFNLDAAISLATSVTSPIYTASAAMAINAAAGQNITVKLGDAAGANKISFVDSASVEVASINSLGAFSMGAITFSGLLTANASATINTAGTALNLGTDNNSAAVNLATGTTARTVGIANSAAAHLVTIGSTSGAAALTLQYGTGNFLVTGSATGTITLGAATQTGTTTIVASTTTATLNLANADGAKTINIGAGVDGNTISIGNGVNTSAQSINIAAGASAANSTVNILSGNASAGTQTLNLATGNRASAVNIANGTGGNTVIISGGVNSAAQTTSIANGASGADQTVNILSGNAAAGTQTLNLAGGTGAKVVNIAAGAAANVVTIGSATGAASLALLSGTGNITATSAATLLLDSVGVLELNSSAGVIGIGNDAVAQNINIGTGAAARTITIGNTTGASSVVVTGGTGAMNFGAQAVAHTTTIGSTTGASATIIQGGTGRITVTGTVKEIDAEYLYASGIDLVVSQSPIMQSNATTGVAPTGVNGDVNLMALQDGVIMEQFIIGTQTIIAPRMTSNGLNIALDNTNAEGAEYNFGAARNNSQLAFTIGTSAAFEATFRIYVEDISGCAPLLCGFRKVQANSATYASYTDFYALGLNSATSATNVTLASQLNTGGVTLQNSGTAWGGDAAACTLKVLVSAAGVVTATINGGAPATPLAYTFDNGDVVVPFIHFLNGADVAGEVSLVTMKIGFQA